MKTLPALLFVGSWLAIFPTAFANGGVSAIPSPTPASSANAAQLSIQSEIANDDLSRFKTAEELQKYYHLMRDKQWADDQKEKRTQKQIYERQIALVERYVAAFEKRFPHDDIRWWAELECYAEVYFATIRTDEPEFKSKFDSTKALLQTIIDAPDADIRVKQFAFYDQIRDNAWDVENEADFEKWDKQLSSEIAKHPELAARVNDDIQSLRAQERSHFDKTGAAAIYDALAKTTKSQVDARGAKARAAELRSEINQEKQAKEIAEYYKKQPLEIKATAVSGSEVDLAKLRGKVVLIDFWGTHCGPCLMAMPELAKTYAALHDKGFEIIGIGGAQDQAELAKMIKARKIAGTQIFDANGKFAKQCGIFTGIPRVWILNKQGLVVSDELGYDEEKDDSAHLIPRIEKLLAE